MPGARLKRSHITIGPPISGAMVRSILLLNIVIIVHSAKTVLDEEDDVAHVMLGGKWRMPTDAEWAELRTRCVREYTTYSGVRGIRVTGPNGNSIFLPTAGSRYGYRTYTNYCFYWSSSLYTDIPYAAFRMPLEWDSVDGSLIRCYGLPVRPVCD